MPELSSPGSLMSRVRRTPPPADPDALAYLAAVEAADGAALEPAVRAAVTDFVLGCKADGIWAALDTCCLMMGARTLAGALVPLRGPVPTNFGFVAGDYDRAEGLLGNGTSKYLATGYVPPLNTQNDTHLAVWVGGDGSVGAGLRGLIGSTNGSVGALHHLGYTDTQRIVRLHTGGQYAETTRPIGLWGASRTASNQFTEHRANTSRLLSSTATLAPAQTQVTVFARGGSDFAAARLPFFSAGRAINLAALNLRVGALIRAILIAFGRLGPELVTNPAGVVFRDASTSINYDSGASLVAGRSYLFRFRIADDISTQSSSWRVNASGANIAAPFVEAGAHGVYHMRAAVSGSGIVRLHANVAGVSLSIADVSVREVLPPAVTTPAGALLIDGAALLIDANPIIITET